MADNTPIEWTDATWNPITGCSVVSPGCTNCYAMKLAGTRLKHHPSREGLTIDTKAGPVWNGQVRLNEGMLMQPFSWRRPRKIFVCAHGDLFHESVPDDWIDRVFGMMTLCQFVRNGHTFQILTKRTERMREYLSAPFSDLYSRWLVTINRLPRSGGFSGREFDRYPHPLPNLHIGVSVEDQRRADERIPDLLATPAVVRFLSCEPLLGPVDLTDIKGLDWVIAGGESGPGARPAHPQWFRDIRDQCQTARVPFFFKQWGEWHPSAYHDHEQVRCRDTPLAIHSSGNIECRSVEAFSHIASRATGWVGMCRIGKKRAGAILDGREWKEMPDGR